MDSDLISRKALMSMHYDMKYTEVKGEVFVRLEDVVNWIKLIPTVDAVEVVRCKDCRFSDCRQSFREGETYCTISCLLVGNNEYCSNGAKMDGGDKA